MVARRIARRELEFDEIALTMEARLALGASRIGQVRESAGGVELDVERVHDGGARAGQTGEREKPGAGRGIGRVISEVTRRALASASSAPRVRTSR